VATQTITIAVDHAPVFTSKTADLVHTGTAFSYPVTTELAYPAPTITTTSTLPAGVSLTDNHNGTAALNGTPGPTSGGVYPLTITATNGVGAPVTQSFTLTVYQAPTVVLPANFTITSQQAMNPQTVDYAGYPAPLVKASGLPKGVTLTNNGDGTATISGTPVFKVNGVFNVTVSASSKAGTYATPTPLQVSVDSPPFFTSKAPPLAHTGTAITPFTVTTLYGYPVPTISTTSPLPAGITLTDNGNGTATLSGTPSATAGGVYSITFEAANGLGAGGVGPGPVTQTVTWTVYQAPTLSGPATDTIAPGLAMAPLTIDYQGYPAPVVKASGLPKGLSLVNNGNGTATISGTPVAGDTSSTVTITAASKAGTATESIAITIT
jgi:hypothetical protein